MNSWTKENYPKLLVIGLGMTAAISLSYYLYSNYIKDDAKINKQDIAQHFAKRLKSKMEESKKTDGLDWAKFIMQVHDACNPELDKVELEYQEKLNDVKIRESLDYLKILTEYQEKKQKIIDEADEFIRSKSPLPDGTIADLDIHHLLENLKQAGAQVNPLFDDFELFQAILKEAVELEEQFRAENPNVSSDLIRKHSSAEIMKKYNYEPDQIELAIEAHKAKDNPIISSYVNKFQRVSKETRERILPNLVKGVLSLRTKPAQTETKTQ